MFDDLTVKRIRDLADDVSRIAARNYVGIDHDDIGGHILECVFASSERFERHLDNDGWLWAVMYAEGIKYCNKQVRDFMFYSDEHYYTPQEIRDLLEKAYSTDVPTGESIAINDATMALLDLQIAFNKLNFRDKDLISRKIGQREKLDETERRAYYRATEHMSAILNGTLAKQSRARIEHVGPGARKVLSNAQAANQTKEF